MHVNYTVHRLRMQQTHQYVEAGYSALLLLYKVIYLLIIRLMKTDLRI